MRQLATIQKIHSIRPIEGADAIEVASVLGWNVVIKKGEFRDGDLVVYAEVDSILPEREEFEFLRNKQFRIRTMRLRGQVSQGILFPLSVLDDPWREYVDRMMANGSIPNRIGPREGQDVTELLGVVKHEPVIPACLAGEVKGTFPSFMSKTDEERVQNIPEVLERHRNKEFYVSEKLDGSSMTVYLRDDEFGVCSRNLNLRETEGNTQWRLARQLDLDEKMRALRINELGFDFGLQGELIGPGIQGNKYGLKTHEFRVYNVYNITASNYLGYYDMCKVCNSLQIQMVPILHSVVIGHTVDEMVEYARGRSVLSDKVHREGIVIRPFHEERDPHPRLNGRLSFKVINPDFLLKFNDD